MGSYTCGCDRNYALMSALKKQHSGLDGRDSGRQHSGLGGRENMFNLGPFTSASYNVLP